MAAINPIHRGSYLGTSEATWHTPLSPTAIVGDLVSSPSWEATGHSMLNVYPAARKRVDMDVWKWEEETCPCQISLQTAGKAHAASSIGHGAAT